MTAGAWLALLGAVLLTALDAVHTHTGTLEYAHPIAFRAAWWVPLLFASSATVGGLSYARGYAKLGGPPAVASTSALLRGLFAMSVLYASSGLLPASNASKLIVLATAALVLHRVLDGSRVGAILVVVAAIVGPLVEATLIGLGLFHYTHPDFLGVPMWLPALYACIAPPVGQLARRLTLRQRPTARAALAL